MGDQPPANYPPLTDQHKSIILHPCSNAFESTVRLSYKAKDHSHNNYSSSCSFLGPSSYAKLEAISGVDATSPLLVPMFLFFCKRRPQNQGLDPEFALTLGRKPLTASLSPVVLYNRDYEKHQC